MTLVKIWIFGIFSLFFCGTFSCHAEHFKLGSYAQSDPFFLELLQEALNAADGDHTLENYSLVRYNQARTLSELSHGQAPFNLYLTGHDKDREQTLLQIDIPLTKGLLGTRVLFVQPKSDAKINQITSFEDLKTFTFASGTTWPDTPILKHNGLTVVPAPNESLPIMLARQRVDIYPRSVMEWERNKEALERYFKRGEILLNTHVILKYKSDLFFYMNKSDIKHAAILQQGLERIMENGVYDRMFKKASNLQIALDAVMKHNPIVFELENPRLSKRVQNIPEKYWYQFPKKP
ncbi:hypothetical protein [Kordiimonas laminariae]|uniref:hypothetical protein n=1 Tax=Kordiimonas laminariae TaxID=2917717 RepID=UPI001FF14805|nr:hypothetical protein [Kordiimonas laminariae]MCK0067902.1 hypothetical protein [Kordiimonas laminariae]